MAAQLPTGCEVVHGEFESLSPKVRAYVAEKANVCQPSCLHIVDGSVEENEALVKVLIDAGLASKLTKHSNW